MIVNIFIIYIGVSTIVFFFFVCGDIDTFYEFQELILSDVFNGNRKLRPLVIFLMYFVFVCFFLYLIPSAYIEAWKRR